MLLLEDYHVMYHMMYHMTFYLLGGGTSHNMTYRELKCTRHSGGVGAVVRSLPSNPKVPGSIPGSAESGIFGDLLSR